MKYIYVRNSWLLVLLFCSSLGFCQTEEWVVSTLTTARANGDITVAENGDIYIADFGRPGLGNGSTVVKIKPDGSKSVFATGINSAGSGITIDSNGNLYVAAFNGGDVFQITPSGNKTKINSGLSGPVGLAVDNNDNLYVAECTVNRISRLVNGTAQTVAGIPGIGCANGLVWGHDNALYVLMWRNGEIYRVDLAGNVSLFASTSGGGGHLELLGDYYYVLGRTAHRVYRVDFNGQVEIFAGTGADGTVDGSVADSEFSRPNGIGVNRQTGELFVTGSSDGSLNDIPIRKIALESVEVGNDFEINYGLAGSWYNPNTDGQGFVFDFAVSTVRFDALVYWFTYDDIAADDQTELMGFGTKQSRWFTAIGPVQGNTVVMPIYRTAHGVFDDSAAVTSDVVGSMELEFFSCFEALLTYDFTVPENKSGSIPLQRIAPDIMCEVLAGE